MTLPLNKGYKSFLPTGYTSTARLSNSCRAQSRVPWRRRLIPPEQLKKCEFNVSWPLNNLSRLILCIFCVMRRSSTPLRPRQIGRNCLESQLASAQQHEWLIMFPSSAVMKQSIGFCGGRGGGVSHSRAFSIQNASSKDVTLWWKVGLGWKTVFKMVLNCDIRQFNSRGHWEVRGRDYSGRQCIMWHQNEFPLMCQLSFLGARHR